MNCIICGQNKCVKIREEGYEIQKCLSCGIKFFDPPPTKENVENFYKADTYFKNGGGDIGYRDYLHEEKIHRINFKEALMMMPVQDSLLDFGCAYGLLIDEAKKMGWRKIDGVELCKKAREYINENLNKDAKIFKDVDELIESGRKYDTCTMCGVMEHLLDPRGVVKKIYTVINDGGRILITTTNYDGLMPLRWRGIEHPVAFSKKALMTLMQESGFKVEFCKIYSKWYDTTELIDRISFYVGFSLKFMYFLAKFKKSIKIPNNEIICLAKK